MWQTVCLEQHRRWRIQVGRCYRYLIGLAAAQIASAFLLIGLPRDPGSWERGEYRLFSDMVRLERWRQASLLEQLLERRTGQLERWELTAAFESVSEERERRIAAWCQRLLIEMMGVRPANEEMDSFERSDPQQRRLEISRALVRICPTAENRGGNDGHTPFEARRSLRSSKRILRNYLEYDRRMHESYGTA
jgi:hypothetical protein